MTSVQEPEIHIIGEITGASGIMQENAFCAFEVKSGKQWLCVGGDEHGQTQVDYPDQTDDLYVWNHPLDLHYFTKTFQGWPKIAFEVWSLDPYGGRFLCGYGFLPIPFSPGTHELECSLWRPVGNHREEIDQFLTGQTPILRDRTVIDDIVRASDDRHRLITKPAGTIHLSLSILIRNISSHDLAL